MPFRNRPLALRNQARQLRKSMTPEEIKRWWHLRVLNKQGMHFRRQVPLDGYILDFAEYTHRLIIEVDGSQHGMPEQEMRDQIRDAHFEKTGFRILRFWNTDINNELAGVIDKILATLALPPSGPAGRLPRKEGE